MKMVQSQGRDRLLQVNASAIHVLFFVVAIWAAIAKSSFIFENWHFYGLTLKYLICCPILEIESPFPDMPKNAVTDLIRRD